MMNITVTFVVGRHIVQSTETKVVLADNNQTINDRISWGSIAKMPMETTIVFTIQVFSKEGEGLTCGVGALKIFD